MKQIISIQSSFLILIAFLTFSCSKNNDRVRRGLHGKVKSINEKYYVADNRFGEWTYGDSSSYGLLHFSFTDKGVYSGTEFYDTRRLSRKDIPKYKDGKLIEACQYDQDGKLIDKTKINQLSAEVEEIISFDENGRKKSISKYYYKNNIFIGSEDSLFEKGKPIGKKIGKAIIDSNGNIQSYLVVDEKGKEVSYKRYEYLEFDKMKNWIKSITFSSKNSKKPDYFIIREIEYF
ncbi:MAG TPA: hypothetical protein VIK55_19765 [Paludibacter sp.]